MMFEWNGMRWTVMAWDIAMHTQYAFAVRGDKECMFCGDCTAVTLTVTAIARGARLTFFACGNCASAHGLNLALPAPKEALQ